METKTIKLVSHNFQAEFYLHFNEVDERLIAEGKEQNYWRVIFNYLKDSEFPWVLGAQGRALDLSDNIRGICTSDFIVWATSVLADCRIYQKGEPFVHGAGAVEEIVT